MEHCWLHLADRAWAKAELDEEDRSVFFKVGAPPELDFGAANPAEAERARAGLALLDVEGQGC